MRLHHNVGVQFAAALLIPDVRVKPVIHHDVIVSLAAITLPELKATIQQQVVVNFVVRRTIVEVDIPSMVAAPAAVSQDGGWRAERLNP